MRLDHLLSKESLAPGRLVHFERVRSERLPVDALITRLLGPCPGWQASASLGTQWQVGFLLFRFEGAIPRSDYRTTPARAQLAGVLCAPGVSATALEPRQRVGYAWPARSGTRPSFLENSIASTSIFVLQATKSQRWMPWRLMPMKDVGGCEKPRGAADQASIRGYPNGETQHPSWGVTPV